MAKVICMSSAKGGSGKTVLCATFATALTSLGKRVLIVDSDASTNGLTLMYLKEVMVQGEYAIGENRKPLGTFELLSKIGFPEIVKLPNGVDLIPASYSFQNTEAVIVKEFEIGLKNIIALYRDDYDYIFLDAQAGSDNYAQVAINKTVSNEVIIVSEYDPLSAAGIERLKGLFREDLTYNRTWVLLNKMLPDFIKSFSDFLEVAKYLSPVPWDADVVKAYSRRKLALDMENGNAYTLATIQTLKSLLGDEILTDVKKWTLEKESAIRLPIETQYNDAKRRLENINSYKDYVMKLKKWMNVATKFGSIILVFLLSNFMKEYLISHKLNNFVLQDYIILIASGFFAVLLFLMAFIEKTHINFDLTKSENIERKLLLEEISKLEALKNADIERLIKSRDIY